MTNDGMNILGRHVENGVISVVKAKVDASLALRFPGKDLGM
jgi:hypothetical protein